ncbi:outer membrane putative beta-barrel porin/alpha-amylase [Flavobacterium cutihirudinis]|uniref:Outer membrane putative beta-barrel porin/alpha-amylase n=1 Tax=Flavobacterium cutihirudinis TaxID=1265740 RepID=A0A3D9FZT5_9FLAO|nr:transporter [Flavobacterium cutihirudinis]RED26454.1 outer membrane putative beta-barrel porin/alpha-amylase [Flavobacterium cutihirudinis]
MLKIKNLLFASLFLSPQLFFAQYTDVINSNRPGETMSAYAVGKSVIQAELGVYGIKEKHDLLDYDASGIGTDFTLRYGAFLEQLEFVFDMQYQSENFESPYTNYKKNNFRQTVLGAKYLIYDPYKNYKREVNIYSYKANRNFQWRELIPAVSVFAGANFVGADNPYYFSADGAISPKVSLITQNILGGGSWVFVTNIIADYIGTDYPSYGYVLTLTHGFNDHWSGFIENQVYKSDFYSDSILRGGAAYLLSSNMQVDASISTNFKNTPSILYGGIGVSWRYDGWYKDKVIATKNKEKAKKNAENKKEIDYQEKERKRKSKYE